VSELIVIRMKNSRVRQRLQHYPPTETELSGIRHYDSEIITLTLSSQQYNIEN